MIPAEFNYVAPTSLNDAISLLKVHTGARVLAGGQDLLTQMKQRRLAAPVLVDLRHVGELKGIETEAQEHTRIWAMTTCTQLSAHEAVQARAAALAEAADSIGDAQVRNRATLGGNLAYGDPAADLPPAVLVLDGVIQTLGAGGPRSLPADQFFLGAFMTVLEPTEVITAVDLPRRSGRFGSAYEKFRNPANNYPLCGVAAAVALDGDGRVRECRVAVTGATAHPRRLPMVEASLEGRQPNAENITAACRVAGEGQTFVQDLFASDEFRAHLTSVLAETALTRAVARAAEA